MVVVVSRPSERITRVFFGSNICLVFLILIACNVVSHLHDSSDTANNGIAFFVDAFSRPQRLAVSTTRQQRQQNRRTHNDAPFRIIRGETDDTTIPLFAAIPFYVTEVENDDDRKKKAGETIDTDTPAFLIETITGAPSSISGDFIYKKIANLCIDVFFKELLDPTGKGSVNLLKSWQISYLKNLQAADLERRRNRCPTTNEMFLAYEVKKTEGMTDVLSQPLLMDEELEAAFNLNGNKNNKNNKIDEDACYVRGELLGFVEITQRSYGLGGVAGASTPVESSSSSSTSTDLLEDLSLLVKERQMRPVLTNLAVLKDSRKYGIGSKLLDACEAHVIDTWKMNEIVLEVEDYNDGGLEFYKRRGFEVLFSDPASRRYDIQGFWLSKVRCRRDIMRKVVENKPTNMIMQGADSFFRRIRDTVGSF